MRHGAITLGALITIGIASLAKAGDTFARTDACDELSLARSAEAVGDRALADALGAGRYEAVVAIRASSYARAPELLIPALAALACGRDPTLAPEAAGTLRALSARLAPSELAGREVLRSDLDRARASLRCERPPRPDIATTLEELAALVP